MRQIVFVDTCIIIEAHRTGCWAAIAAKYDIHLVRSVFDEALAGRKNAEGYIEVHRDELAAKTVVHEVTTAMMAQALAACPDIMTIDTGERELLAFVHRFTGDAFVLTTADKAAVKVACALGLSDRLLSLEELAPPRSNAIEFLRGYSRAALSAIKTEYLLENLQ